MCALQQFNDDCNTNKLLPDYQSAYRTNYSIETSLVKLINDILWTMKQQEVTALTAIDLSADVLEHQFGVMDTALNWFKTYLYPRKFTFDVDGHHSREIDLKFSVPHSNLAGPVLYLVYAST